MQDSINQRATPFSFWKNLIWAVADNQWLAPLANSPVSGFQPVEDSQWWTTGMTDQWWTTRGGQQVVFSRMVDKYLAVDDAVEDSQWVDNQ